jgi:hypothetical protein
MTNKTEQTTSTKRSNVLWDVKGKDPREVVVYCPGCKALETVVYNSDGLMPTSRFTQKSGAVYHRCGSDVPCRFYSLS